MNGTKHVWYHLVSFFMCCDAVTKGVYVDGDVILGGLIKVHQQGSKDGQCGVIDASGLGGAVAMIFAIEKINNDSSLLPNITLGYDIRDYCESVTIATQITYNLVKKKCNGNMTQGEKRNRKSIVTIIGPYESRIALPIAACLQMFNISAISGTTTSPQLGSTIYNNFYRTIPSDRFLAKAMADTIDYFNWTYVGAVGLADSYGRNGVWSLAKEANKPGRHFCLAFKEFLDLENPVHSIREIVRRLRQHGNVRVIVAWLFGSFEEMFYEEVKRQNLNGRVWIVSYISPTSLSSLLDGSLGFQPASFYDGGFQNHVPTYISDKAQPDHLSKWWDELMEVTEGCSLDHKGKAVNSQAKSCYQHLTRQIYASNIPYLIDAVYAVAYALEMDIKAHAKDTTAHNRGRVPYASNLYFNRQRLLHGLHFSGLTGKVSFDDFGDRKSAVYEIINFQKPHLEQVVVGKWEENDRNDSKHLQFVKEIRWNPAFSSLPKSDCSGQCSAGTRKSLASPCCWQCVPCPQGTVNPTAGSYSCIKCPQGKHANQAGTQCVDLPLKTLTYSSIGGIIILVFAVCGVLLSLFSFAIIIKYWNTPIVRASNRQLSVALLFGMLLLLSIVFINFLEPTNIVCKIIYPWRYITDSFCQAILLIKILHISKAFRVPVVQCLAPNSLSNKKKGAIVIILHVILLLLLLAWLLLDPPTDSRNIYPEQYIFVECQAYSSSVGKYLFLLTCSYIFAQTFLCAFCSFKIRNIPENFSSAKRISFSKYIFLFSMATYQPVEFSMDGWYVTAVDCVTTLLSAYGFLSCIFLPQLYILLFRPEENSLNSVRQDLSMFSFGPNLGRVNPMRSTIA